MDILSYYQYIPGIAALLFLFSLILRFIYNKRAAFRINPLLYFFPIFSLVLLSIFSYLLSRGILGEYFFKESLKKNSVSEIYDLQRKAIITNPNIDKYRVRFSQTNLIIANSLLDKAKESSPEDRQTAAKAVQAAIEEAKAAVKLDDKKAANWANLANVYKNLLNIAENADTWAIAAYQRAIVLDPQNAVYHLELGGIYYLLQDYSKAIGSFEQAKSLKTGWANVYYNLAWTYYQQGKKDLAISNMEKTISLLANQNNLPELKKAETDLALFKTN